MTSTYSTHAEICTKFYDLTVDAALAGGQILRQSGAQAGQDALFVGGMFSLADYLIESGVQLMLADYSAEMVEIGQRRFPGASVAQADLRNLPYTDRFDLVFVVGRVFTHMISDADLYCALRSCRRAIRDGGRLYLDNYEDSKILKTRYFNGVIRVAEGDNVISRESSIQCISESSPCVVRWTATYAGSFEGKPFRFDDTMEQRAWSRNEIRHALNETGFISLEQGDNFDETSFYTLAQAV